MRRLAVFVLLLWAAPADAATYCVGTAAPGCVDQPSLSAALAAAADAPGDDTIRIGRRTEPGPVADAAGEPVHVIGAGPAATVLEGVLDQPVERAGSF